MLPPAAAVVPPPKTPPPAEAAAAAEWSPKPAVGVASKPADAAFATPGPKAEAAKAPTAVAESEDDEEELASPKERMAQLQELLDDGLVTQEEFDAARKAILDSL